MLECVVLRRQIERGEGGGEEEEGMEGLKESKT